MCNQWQWFKEFYPQELGLKKENVSSTKASFLDIDLEIKDNKFSINIYIERGSFPFEIIRSLMPIYCVKSFIILLVLRYSV